MYVHDIHVLYYFFIGLLGIFVGQFLDYANSRLANHKKIFCKELFKQKLFIQWQLFMLLFYISMVGR